MNYTILKIGTNLRFGVFFFTLHVILEENAWTLNLILCELFGKWKAFILFYEV